MQSTVTLNTGTSSIMDQEQDWMFICNDKTYRIPSI